MASDIVAQHKRLWILFGAALFAAFFILGFFGRGVAEFMQLPAIETLRWLRVIGDTVFTVGAMAFAWFMAGLFFGWSYERAPQQHPAPVGAARRSA